MIWWSVAIDFRPLSPSLPGANLLRSYRAANHTRRSEDGDVMSANLSNGPVRGLRCSVRADTAELGHSSR
jgi:hypothetical protein